MAEARRRDNEVNLIDILTQLALRKRFIAMVTGFATLVGLALALLLPVKYTATTEILTPQQTQSSSAMMMMNQLASSGAGSMAALAAGGLGLKNPNDIYVGLLGSRPVSDAIIKQFGLESAYRSANMTEARRELASNTSVAAQKSGFISVSVIDKDKKRAADMANAYTEQLRVLTKSLAVTEASQRRLFYEDQLKDAKEALIAAELSFQRVQQAKGVVQPVEQAKAMIEGLASLRAEVMAKQVELKALRSYSTDRNPEVQMAENELSSLQAEVSRLEQRSNSKGFSELGLEDVPGAGIEYLSAEHEVVYRQALFDLLIKQYDAARLDESKEATIIQVVEPAIEPDRKTSPKRAQILLISIITGLFAAIAWVLLTGQFNRMRNGPEQSFRLRMLREALKSK